MYILLTTLDRLVAAWCLGLVHAYRWTLGPLIRVVGGPACGCRFEPSCSAYALDCFRALPCYRALWLTVRRVARCNPFVEGGWDPAPLPKAVDS